jgi:hypothetical protein
MDGAPGNLHALRADRRGRFSISLWGPYRLIIAPDHNPLPRLDDGGIDLYAVTAVRILEVVDYHGD